MGETMAQKNGGNRGRQSIYLLEVYVPYALCFFETHVNLDKNPHANYCDLWLEAYGNSTRTNDKVESIIPIIYFHCISFLFNQKGATICSTCPRIKWSKNIIQKNGPPKGTLKFRYRSPSKSKREWLCLVQQAFSFCTLFWSSKLQEIHWPPCKRLMYNINKLPTYYRQVPKLAHCGSEPTCTE